MIRIEIPRERGVELLGVVRERWSAATPGAASLHRAAERPPRIGPGILVAAAAALIIGTAYLMSPRVTGSGSKATTRLDNGTRSTV